MMLHGTFSFVILMILSSNSILGNPFWFNIYTYLNVFVKYNMLIYKSIVASCVII